MDTTRMVCKDNKRNYDNKTKRTTVKPITLMTRPTSRSLSSPADDGTAEEARFAGRFPTNSPRGRGASGSCIAGRVCAP
jgi:hypothetical protein